LGNYPRRHPGDQCGRPGDIFDTGLPLPARLHHCQGLFSPPLRSCIAPPEHGRDPARRFSATRAGWRRAKAPGATPRTWYQGTSTGTPYLSFIGFFLLLEGRTWLEVLPMYNRAEFSRARRQTIQKNGTPLLTVPKPNLFLLTGLALVCSLLQNPNC
jgi:hypothetical protein